MEIIITFVVMVIILSGIIIWLGGLEDKTQRQGQQTIRKVERKGEN